MGIDEGMVKKVSSEKWIVNNVSQVDSEEWIINQDVRI